MQVRMRVRVGDIDEKVQGIDVIPADYDDGTWHVKLRNLTAREAKTLLVENGWAFAATTTSMEGSHYDLYWIEMEEDIPTPE